MSDGRNFGQVSGDPAEQARRALERLQGKTDSQPGAASINSLDVLRQQVLGGGQRRSPWDNPVELPPTDKPPERPAPVNKGVLEVTYGEAGFDAKIAQNNYTKLVIKGLPKDLQPSPWIDEENGKGFFFWLKNQKNPDGSDRNRHYFPSNLKEIEIAQYQGNIYKPVMINVDEMRIAATQAFMRKQNDQAGGFASYKNATDAYSYAAGMSKVAGQALDYQEKLLREGANSSPWNPYFRIYLADVLAAQAIQPVLQAITSGQTAYFDNPYTRAKIEEAIKETQNARLITQQYGDIRKPPSYEMPLSPFSLNPYSYNPDYYWSGAAYQASIREVQLTLLQKAIVYGKLPIQLPPIMAPKP